MKKTVGQSIQEALMTRIKIEENGRSHTVTAQEVIIRNLVHAAAKRDTRAIHVLFALRERYQDSKETTLDPTDLESEDRKIIEEHLAELRTNNPAVKASAPDDVKDKNPKDNGESDDNAG